MRRQTEAAIAEADLVLFVIDARAGITPSDEHFAPLVRTSGRPVALVANKAESRAADGGIMEAYSLGFGEPIPVSAEHGLGMPDVYDAIRDAMPAEEAARSPTLRRPRGGAPREAKPLQRRHHRPAERRQVDAGQPPDRRGAHADRAGGRHHARLDRRRLDWRGRAFRLVDTAGIRRKAKVVGKLEKLSVGDALRAIRFAEVVILLMDATEPLEKQDLQLADLVASEGRALVLALNKWDLVADPQARLKELEADLERDAGAAARRADGADLRQDRLRPRPADARRCFASTRPGTSASRPPR